MTNQDTGKEGRDVEFVSDDDYDSQDQNEVTDDDDVTDVQNNDENNDHHGGDKRPPRKPDIDPMQIPSPKEIQEEIRNYMQKKFGRNVQIIASPVSLDEMSHMGLTGDEAQDDRNGTGEQEQQKNNEEGFDLNFKYKPKQIKEYLDKYVIEQSNAKKALAIAVCDHYNHVRESYEAYKKGDDAFEDENYSKQNVLMLGPTGVGKTYLIKNLARLIGVPFVKADATRFTEMGYVGANVDDLVRDLVHMANGDVKLAQYGIIYFDEADKIAGSRDQSGKDISGRGVQHALLKLMEETEIDLKSAHDIASQMQAFMDFQKTGKIIKQVINTKHILFIVSGAFHGLDDIIKRRLRTRAIGLKFSQEKDRFEVEDIFEYVSTKDLIDFGFEPEFVGRLPVRLSCSQLSEDDLYKILKEAKGSIIYQYIRSFKSYGIDIHFDEEALRGIAHLAHEEKIGARALMTVCEKIFRNFKFELPSSKVKGFVVSRQLVNDPDKELNFILANPESSFKTFFIHRTKAILASYFKELGLKLSFSDEALEGFYQRYSASTLSVEKYVIDFFNYFLNELQVIKKDKGIDSFMFDLQSVIDPIHHLDTLVKRS